METPTETETQSTAPRCGRPRASALALAAIVAAYAAFQAWYFVPGCRESDTATYLALAERLAKGGPIGVVEDDEFLYQWYSWVENHRGETVPKFAPGYSLLLAVALKLGGEKVAYALNPFLGALTLIGAYLLFRLWLSTFGSLLATFALATTPLFIRYTSYPLAHAADIFFVTWGMFALFKWVETPRTAWALAAGLLLGYSQLVRPPDALLVLPVLAAAVFVLARPWPAEWRQWAQPAVLLAAYAIFPVVHLFYNASVFGGPLTTGYALSGEQSAFALSRLPRNASYALQAMGSTGLGVYLGLGLIGLVLDWRQTLLKLLWVFPIALLYMMYYWAPRPAGGAYARFLLGLYPALIGSAFVPLERLSISVLRQRALAAGLCALVFVMYFPGAARLAQGASRGAMRLHEQASDLAETHLRDGAAVFGYRQPGICLSRGKGFRVYELQAFEANRISSIIDSVQSPRARVMVQPAREQRLRQFYARNARRLDVLLRERVQKFLGDRQVAFVMPAGHVRKYAEILGTDLTLNCLTEWQSGEGSQWGIYEVRPK